MEGVMHADDREDGEVAETIHGMTKIGYLIAMRIDEYVGCGSMR
jgi:hypothetical protein